MPNQGKEIEKSKWKNPDSIILSVQFGKMVLKKFFKEIFITYN